jgi:hypothetical protein
MQMSSITPAVWPAPIVEQPRANVPPHRVRPRAGRRRHERSRRSGKQRRHSTRSRSLWIAPRKRAGDGLGVTARGSRNTASHHASSSIRGGATAITHESDRLLGTGLFRYRISPVCGSSACHANRRT